MKKIKIVVKKMSVLYTNVLICCQDQRANGLELLQSCTKPSMCDLLETNDLTANWTWKMCVCLFLSVSAYWNKPKLINKNIQGILLDLRESIMSFSKPNQQQHVLVYPSWPCDTIWQQRSWSTLVQVMAYCLKAPSHYLNQCWLIIR